jgi:hypothetical protein
MVFTRSYMRPIRDFRSEVTPEMLARNPPEFAKLMGMHCIYPQDPKLMKGGLKAMMEAVNAGEGQWS